MIIYLVLVSISPTLVYCGLAYGSAASLYLYEYQLFVESDRTTPLIVTCSFQHVSKLDVCRCSMASNIAPHCAACCSTTTELIVDMNVYVCVLMSAPEEPAGTRHVNRFHNAFQTVLDTHLLLALIAVIILTTYYLY